MLDIPSEIVYNGTINNEKGDKNMVVEKDINGLDFIYENKDELAFEPDPNQLEPNEDEVDD